MTLNLRAKTISPSAELPEARCEILNQKTIESSDRFRRAFPKEYEAMSAQAAIAFDECILARLELIKAIKRVED